MKVGVGFALVLLITNCNQLLITKCRLPAVGIVQWQNARLWLWMSWVRPPLPTPKFPRSIHVMLLLPKVGSTSSEKINLIVVYYWWIIS